MLLVGNISQLVTPTGHPCPLRGSALGDLNIVSNAAVLIDGKKIFACGPEAEIRALPEAKAAEYFDAKGCAVLPGFCDSHTHPVYARPRVEEYEMKIRGASYEEIAARGGGILESVKAVRAADEAALLGVALENAERFLEYGTTFIEAKSGYGLDFESEMKLLRVIAKIPQQTRLEVVATFLGAHQVPLEYKNRREEYVRLLCERMIPAVADDGLAEYCDVFCDGAAFSIDESKRILEAAMKRGLKSKLHADQLSSSGAALLGVELGAVSVDHLEKIGEAEIASLSKSETIATLLPGSVFHLGLNRYAPARGLVDAGAAVALATDFNPGSSPGLNMQMAMALACDMMRMTPAEALSAATQNAACAMGRGEIIGSLEPGKQADLFIASVADFRMIPYHFGMNHCRTVIKKGKIV